MGSSRFALIVLFFLRFLVILVYSKVIWPGNIADIGDLLILSRSMMRATYNYARMKKALRIFKFKIFSWSLIPGTGWHPIWCSICLNYMVFLVLVSVLAVTSVGTRCY